MQRLALIILAFFVVVRPLHAGSLAVSFAAVPAGSVVNLTENGSSDWVHWGLLTDSSIVRKAGVIPQISDFTVLPSRGFAYRYDDNWNGYSWSDGTPQQIVTNTPTGVWAYDNPAMGTGFRLSAPAETNVQILRVYVGAYAARGRFVASLSDGSAGAYTNPVNEAVNNTANGPGGVYTISYAADSPGQTLTINYTLQSAYGSGGNVTLQAAALSIPGANTLPFVALTSPAQTTSVTSQDNVTLLANATDSDGNIALVEFYTGETRLGDSAGPEFSLTWSNPPPGRHILTARAIDNLGGMSISAPMTLFVSGSGGWLSGTRAVPPTTVSLTAEGTSDWAHWGLLNATSFNQRSTGGSQISNATRVGTNAAVRYTNNRTAFSWNNGSPTASTGGSATGIYITGVTNGFEFTAPADTTARTLRIYCGLYGANAEFQAWLSDFSAPAFIDVTLTNVFGTSYAVYTLNYAAASHGQRLHVRHTVRHLFDFDFGNVNLQAATLREWQPLLLRAGNFPAEGFQFSFLTETGRTYSAQFAPALGSTNWQTFSNLHGSGGTVVVVDPDVPAPQRFYRVVSE